MLGKSNQISNTIGCKCQREEIAQNKLYIADERFLGDSTHKMLSDFARL
jgi:hypothetical protein